MTDIGTSSSKAHVHRIPSLVSTVLKSIAKTPKIALKEKYIQRSLVISSLEGISNYDIGQLLIDNLTESGRFTDDIIPIYLISPNRTFLSLRNAKITGRYINQIIDQCYYNITSIDVSGTFHIDDEIIEYILNKCKHVSTIDMKNCRKLTDKCMSHILKYKQSQISVLDIGGNINLTTDGIKDFLKRYKGANILHSISLSGLPIDTEVLVVLATHYHSLTSLNVGFAEIDESSLRSLLQEIGSKLTSLGISWLASAPNSTIAQISPEFFTEFLHDACPLLKDLDVCGLKSIAATDLMVYLDKKDYQTDMLHREYSRLRNLKAKFMASTKAQMEQLLLGSFNDLKLEA